MIPVPHACPEIDLPCHRPAGRLVAPELHRAPGRGKDRRHRTGGELAPRVDAEQVREVSVLRLLLLEVLRPLLELSAPTDLIGDQPRACPPHVVAERRVDT